jgi:hypothetical protein
MCKKKVLVVIGSVCKVGEYNMNNVYVNAKNEHFYANFRKDTISNQYFCGVIAKRKKRLVKFVICFH